MACLVASIWSSIARTMKAWWDVKRPARARESTGIFPRIEPSASSASRSGSRSPATRASSMARADLPVMSETTTDT